MPECAFHPGVETEMRCAECERPICPKDMVSTPVGYKCPICAKPARSQYVLVKPAQLFRAAIAAVVVGIGGGVLLGAFGGRIGFFGLILGFMWGSVTAEAARRASGGHRQWSIGIATIVCIVLGAFVGQVSLIVAGIAVFAALSDLALIGR
jgi:hypothetical protein